MIYRIILGMGLAGLLLIGLAHVSLAQSSQNCNINGCRFAGFPMGVPIEVVHSGRGFALKGSESHIMRLNVETLMPLEPTHVRELLSSNKSLEEIRGDIRENIGITTYRGSMMLDRSIYPLVEIEIAPLGDNSTSVKANVADPGNLSAENDTVILGRISVIMAPSDGGIVGNGELELNGTKQAGSYSVLLDMTPAMHGREMMERRS
jgi:hypothetical protein